MAVEKVSAKSDKVKDAEGKAIVVETEYDFGDNLADATAKFGEKVVFDLFKAKAVIKLQDAIRNSLVAGKSPADILASLVGWKPDTVMKIEQDPVKAGVAALQKMDPEARKAFIKQLMEASKTLA